MLNPKDLKYKPHRNEYNVVLFSTTCQTCVLFKTKLYVFDHFLFEYDRKMREHFQTNVSPPIGDSLSIVLPLNDAEMQLLDNLASKQLASEMFSFNDGTPDIPDRLKRNKELCSAM